MVTKECEAIPILSNHSKHASAAVAQNESYSESEWQDAYKISFVRNPWDRLVSLWAMLADTSETADGDCSGNTCLAPSTCPALNDFGDPSIGNESYSCSFTCWFGNECFGSSPEKLASPELSQDMDEYQEARQLDFLVTPEVSASRRALLPDQVPTLTAENSLVDFVGRTENLEEHLRLALVNAGNSETTSRACVQSLVHITEGTVGHAEYREYYENITMRNMSVLALDAATFGYAFDEPAPEEFVLSADSGAVL